MKGIKTIFQEMSISGVAVDTYTVSILLSALFHVRTDTTHLVFALLRQNGINFVHDHITSSDPVVKPEFNPQYFEYGSDLDVIMEIAKFVRNIVQHAPLKDMIEKEVMPGLAVQNGEQFKGKFLSASPCHIQTLMYGTQMYCTNNLRVVDLSIVPLNVASHLQSVAYAIAEQAADIIKSTFLP
ncbi:uncharacterized protein PHACADRAFT_196973 [Phanerochaete carnosa HHB-10118-sp]|uniref:Uncharacterized protein n=1 Tax=Phanerochaete carnosa (strain HHB-10118-sp) TaxID=650164 RepID=K5VSR0_PHACS|nr:uncharacterized protein PHACADRAFT_196973 [Phanerochaete carnosa HHB-10118-sp]EKM54543.1 hypothetical protein PHACADRAFT_196973 [Phanerochaete carnosa HHB-10118-sp]